MKTLWFVPLIVLGLLGIKPVTLVFLAAGAVALLCALALFAWLLRWP